MGTEEKIIVRRLEPDAIYGWAVLAVRAGGRHKGEEQCLAMLCGGNVGKVLAGLCAQQAASLMMVDRIELDAALEPVKED
jgi:hypothetical protein